MNSLSLAHHVQRKFHGSLEAELVLKARLVGMRLLLMRHPLKQP